MERITLDFNGMSYKAVRIESNIGILTIAEANLSDALIPDGVHPANEEAEEIDNTIVYYSDCILAASIEELIEKLIEEEPEYFSALFG